MKTRSTLAILIAAIFCAAGPIASALRADGDIDGPGKKTTVALQSPMEIPGTVLKPGNYVFKQSGSQSGWTIVQIFDRSESTLVTTVLAYPNGKLSSDGQTVMTYSTPGSNGPVLEAVTFPGDAAPDQFAYPAAEADRIGAANRLRIPSTGTNDAYPSSLPDAASSWSAPPNSNAASAATTTPAMAAQNAPAATDATLPQTASSLPLIAMIGVFALAGIVALRKLGTAKS